MSDKHPSCYQVCDKGSAAFIDFSNCDFEMIIDDQIEGTAEFLSKDEIMAVAHAE